MEPFQRLRLQAVDTVWNPPTNSNRTTLSYSRLSDRLSAFFIQLSGLEGQGGLEDGAGGSVIGFGQCAIDVSGPHSELALCRETPSRLSAP